MVLVKKSGMMEVNIKDSIRMHLKKARVNIAGQMETDILENGKTICSTDKVFLCGMMIVYI